MKVRTAAIYTVETEASPERRRRFIPGLALSVALVWFAGSPLAKGQAATVLTGSYNESGTRTDCNSSSSPTSWTQVGTFTITVSPPLSSLGAGGSVTGTFSYSGTDQGCTTQPAGGQGSVTGAVGTGGQLTLTLAGSVAGCSLTAIGTIDEVSGPIPVACLANPGSGFFDVTSRSSSSSGSAAPCINFPAGFIPFTSISYVTAANNNGDHLVVGVPAPGALAAIGAIPLPPSGQTFCDSQVQLAPQQYYPGVYVPTADESGGNFGAFSGLLVDPVTNQRFTSGIIPSSKLNTVFAWRISAAQAGSPNRGWGSTGAASTQAGIGLAAVRLPNGQVLVTQGTGTPILYDPTTGSFSPTGPLLADHGYGLTGTLLNDGRVLLVGGTNTPAAAELYDPSSGTFVSTGSLVYPHGFWGTATLLNDGRVLLVGGETGQGDNDLNDSGAETFDPKTGTFTAAGPMQLNRHYHAATLLPDGRVLITGGQTQGFFGPRTASAEIYDPAGGRFSFAGDMSSTRGAHFSVLLPDGKVLIGGGFITDPGHLLAELFDPASSTFANTGSLITGRDESPAILLPSGQVLIAGGSPRYPVPTNEAELYNPATHTFEATGNMVLARGYAAATLLLDGRVLMVGGRDAAGTSLASAEVYTPTVEGLITSQTGLTFRVAQGNTGLPVQQVAVLSNTDSIPWTVSTHTYQGGNWLIVTPTSGNSVPGAASTTITIAANSAGLATQDYYGTVTLTPTDGKHPPVSISVVLSIVPAGATVPPVVAPSGLVFTGAPGATLKAQTFVISNLTSATITFSGVGSTTPKWFTFAPATGTVSGGRSTLVTVTPTIAGLASGVYPGSIKVTFGDGTSQIVDLLLVLSFAAPTSNGPAHPAATTPACTPTKLLPVFTTLGTGFSAPAAWGTPIIVQVVDDCGSAINSGSVTVSFSDGDPPIALLATGSGNWAATWIPQNNGSGFTVRADAQAPPLTGSVAVTGRVLSNPSVPVVSNGGVVSSGDYTGAPALGLLVSIFGSGLADGAVSAPVPLPPQLGTTQVILGGETLPLLYVSDSVINALIPYDLPVNTSTQLVVQRGNAISVPVTTAIFNASPSVLSTAATGSGQGHVYVIGAGGIETLADQNHPAKVGDNVVIYCIGLGAVAPGIIGGQLALSDPLSRATVPVTVTFGTQTVIAGFAGLTPDETGLYQINTTIPAGVMPGNQVPVTIAAGGASSSAQIFMVVQ